MGFSALFNQRHFYLFATKGFFKRKLKSDTMLSLEFWVFLESVE